jgi:hypothetical protein
MGTREHSGGAERGGRRSVVVAVDARRSVAVGAISIFPRDRTPALRVAHFPGRAGVARRLLGRAR